MASTVLANGIIIPEKYSRDWYNDLYHNWQELDNLLGGGTPKDGTLTIQKNGTTVGTFSANQATDETINISVPAVNDATLTIQQNGTTVDTFTANSSSDKTVNITVPTKTSDLTNDSNFVASTDLATVATSGSYNDLDNKPTIPTKTSDLNNDSGFITSDDTKIPLAGSNQISGDLIPSTNGTVNLGSPSYQWNNAYIKSLTINGVACGDILTHNVSEFVDVTSAQTIGGEKTFSNLRTYFGRDISCYSVRKYGKNLNPTSNTYQYLNFSGNLASEGSTNDWSSGYLEQVVDTNGGSRGRWFVQDTSENNVALEIWASGNEKQVRPLQNGNTDLGTTNRKWKSFNGINPGALSLPSMNFISLDTTNFDVTATTIGTFTPTVDGWAILSMTQKNKPFGIWISHSSYRATFHSAYHEGNYLLFALMPVRANVDMNVYCTADDIDSTRKIDWLRLFPCKGNV